MQQINHVSISIVATLIEQVQEATPSPRTTLKLCPKSLLIEIQVLSYETIATSLDSFSKTCTISILPLPRAPALFLLPQTCPKELSSTGF